jgi:hypothetical protein
VSLLKGIVLWTVGAVVVVGVLLDERERRLAERKERAASSAAGRAAP